MEADILTFSIVLFLSSIFAGFIGALTGLGGGFVIIPLLTLVFKIPIQYAIGASLVAVIATSSGAASNFVKGGFANIKIGMLMEVATVIGSIIGASLVMYLSSSIIAVMLGLLQIFSAFMAYRNKNTIALKESDDKWAKRLQLNGSFTDNGEKHDYTVKNVVGGFSIMGLAGIFSGLLGIGSGVLKVLAFDVVMKMPFKVSSSTSNFMIGVTAAAGAIVYFIRGDVNPQLCMPIILGVTFGAFLGAKAMPKIDAKIIRIVFIVILLFLSYQMIYNGLTGGI